MATLREVLVEKLTKKQQEFLITAFDVVGDIAIIEIKDELVKKQRVIADVVLKLNNHIKVVCKKVGAHHGKYRRQKLEVIAGEKRKITEYKENGVRLRLNVETCYFSPRLSTERKRIFELVKKRERVLVMFSGVAPYPVVIAKNTEAGKIVGIEHNKEAHRFAIENIGLNKIENVELFHGDVNDIIPDKFKRHYFDRILMPLPKGAEDFLDIALKVAKKGSIIHFYDFLHEDQFDLAKEKIEEACKTAGKKHKVLRVVKCGQYSPRVYRICVDFKVL